MKLLLVNPRGPDGFWKFGYLSDGLLLENGTITPPLGLATIAALTPEDWHVQIVDENIEEIPFETDADVVGVTAIANEFARQQEILAEFRRRGKFVVAGGPFTSLCPHEYAGQADCIIVGEAEHTWPAFCRDFPNTWPVYRDDRKIDMRETPIPRYDLLKLDRYLYATVQFSRGCPFDCEFCDAIVLFGRVPRTKLVHHVIQEISVLAERGVRQIFFADDNFIGNKKEAKKLLRALIEWQAEHVELRFGTQATVNVAKDDELLDLLHRANFDWLFLGIETTDTEALREVHKLQNTRTDLLDAVRKCYGAGIHVYGGFVVGFDADDVGVFEAHRRFIMDSGIQVAMISPLLAFPNTPLYARLQAANRLAGEAYKMDNTAGETNIIPANMSRDGLRRRHSELYRSLFTHQAIARRIDAKMLYLRDALVHTDVRGRKKLVEQLPEIATRQIRSYSKDLRPHVIREWSMGLMVRDYVERHHGGDSH